MHLKKNKKKDMKIEITLTSSLHICLLLLHKDTCEHQTTALY